LQKERRSAGMNANLTRREFVAGAAALTLQGGRCRSAPAVSENDFEEFDYGEVELTGGPLKLQYDRIRASYLALDNDRLLKVYRERAGLPAPGAPMGGWYARDGFVPGHSLGQYISGLARMGRTANDAACRGKAAELVEGFAATLGENDRIYAGPNAEKIWPCYVLDKHLAGLIDAYKFSGVEQARNLVPRVFHGALPFIPEGGRDRIGKKEPPYDETYVLPETLFAAYALTGERTFHDRAIAYLLDREFFDPLARGEDVLPGRHAYSHAIALSSAGRARLVLHDEKYLLAMKNAWELLVTTQQYASGGWGPNETFIEPHKGQLYESLRTTVDHFETPCGSYAATKLARYLICATGDARYGDGLERVVFNCLLAVKDPDSDGDYPYYSSYGAGSRKVYYQAKWPCCSGTLMQGVADYVKNIYFRSADSVVVNLFAPSRVRWSSNGTRIDVIQETDYPLGDSVRVHVECSQPAAFALRVRIPGWLEEKPRILINGAPAVFGSERGFAVIGRRWRGGDSLVLELPQRFRTEPIDDLHENTVAILRGSLMYVESNPQPGSAALPRIDRLNPSPDAKKNFIAAERGGNRLFAPFYQVRDESYTTYFDKT
jgi:uncharacterized protein